MRSVCTSTRFGGCGAWEVAFIVTPARDAPFARVRLCTVACDAGSRFCSRIRKTEDGEKGGR